MEELVENFRKLLIFVVYAFAGVWISIVIQEVIHAQGKFPPSGFVYILLTFIVCFSVHLFINKKFKKEKVEKDNEDELR